MLLTETELRNALEPLLDRLLSERLRLFQLQFEPRVQTLIQAAMAPAGVAEVQAGLVRIQAATTFSACFDAVFALSAAMVGGQRLLTVEWQGRTAVWNSEGVGWPTRSDSSRRDIRVRGSVVGALYWPGAELPARMAERLELVLQMASLVLLHLALPAPARERAAAAAGEPKSSARSAPGGETRAQRFASLLLEDLRLYLERERAQELSEGVRAGNWRQRFAPELERCRGAFRDRYGENLAFEEALPRLAELPG